MVKATNDTFDPKSFLPKVGEGKTILNSRTSDEVFGTHRTYRYK